MMFLVMVSGGALGSTAGAVTAIVIDTPVVGGAVAAVWRTDNDGGIVPGAALVGATVVAGDVVADPGMDVLTVDDIGLIAIVVEAAVDAARLVLLEQPTTPSPADTPKIRTTTLGDMVITVAVPHSR